MKSLVKLKNGISLAVIVPLLALGMVALTPMAASAAGGKKTEPATATCPTAPGDPIGVGSGAQCAKSSDQQDSIYTSIQIVTNVLLFIIGAVAVIMIILGGIRYTTSNGDSNQVTAAKNTILYGVIGLIVALLAYAIVSFVVGSFTTTGDGGGAAAKDAAN